MRCRCAASARLRERLETLVDLAPSRAERLVLANGRVERVLIVFRRHDAGLYMVFKFRVNEP
jgi:hypothetical protein